MEFRLSHQPYRKKPYVARWSEEGRVRNRFFASEADRAHFIENYRQQDAAIPLISLFTGMWLNEICQLDLEDIKEEEGVPYIHVRTKLDSGKKAPEKKLKNANAHRAVPIHPQLQELGFLRYVKQKRRAGERLLFPDLDGQGTASPDSFQKKFRRFLDSRNLRGADKKLSFHSFRHGFRDAMRNAQVFHDHACQIGGWEESTSTMSQYGQGASITKLYESISKVEYHGLDLTHLKK